MFISQSRLKCFEILEYSIDLKLISAFEWQQMRVSNKLHCNSTIVSLTHTVWHASSQFYSIKMSSCHINWTNFIIIVLMAACHWHVYWKYLELIFRELRKLSKISSIGNNNVAYFDQCNKSPEDLWNTRVAGIYSFFHCGAFCRNCPFIFVNKYSQL